jgi:SagB-type dehydrogenase family enzyme
MYGRDAHIFWPIFHDSSKDRDKGHPPISPNPEDWPLEWKTTDYKQYPRFKKIPLEGNGGSPSDLFSVIRKRTSERDFSGTGLTASELGTLLKYSAGIVRDPTAPATSRAAPSGGARFPIELYPILLRAQAGISPGLYHYNVKEHALDELWGKSFSAVEIEELFSYSWVADASVALVMTAVASRTTIKYGERGYRYMLLEAGHIAQNAYLVSTALGIKCCATGGTHDTKLEQLIDCDPEKEMVVYGLIFGK